MIAVFFGDAAWWGIVFCIWPAVQASFLPCPVFQIHEIITVSMTFGPVLETAPFVASSNFPSYSLLFSDALDLGTRLGRSGD
jgi:hypothetical protein